MDNKNIKLIKNKQGKIIFVGSMRQFRRRVKKILKSGPAAFLLWQSRQIGYTVSTASEIAGTPIPHMNNLEKKLKDIPKEPGVYQFTDKDGEVIYVGKAKNLKNRVNQYFHNHDNRPQLPYLLQEVADVNYTVVGNELESLFLENTLIKKYYPKYNIQLRDDKNYAFITIDYSSQIPQIGYARKFDQSRIKDKGAGIKYFGPYSAAWKIRNTLNLLRKIFPFCAAQTVSNRPCFYYYLHRCPGVCIGKISIEEYKQQLDRICHFLGGNTNHIKKELRAEMKIASAHKRFETAARLRDQLQSLELLDERQSAILSRPVSWDLVSVSSDQGFACINLFKIREGKMQDKENFIFDISSRRHSDPDLIGEESRTLRSSDAFGTLVNANKEVLQTFLNQYYLEASDAGKEIYIQYGTEGSDAVSQLLESRFSRRTTISTPKRGKQKELIQLGEKNASEYLKNWLASKAGQLDKINEALTQLKDALSLEQIPERIECYDISNIQGTNPVGSMVVFEKGLPKKSEYRKFKIQGKKTPDDFAMMKEMLTRRFARLPGGKAQPSWPTPSLVVIDGGKGQLSTAVEVLTAYSLQHTLPIIGLAKRIEEIFLPDMPEPIVLSHDNPALQLLQRLRDEAHRFGITFHRDLRSKQAVRSALDDIPGVGPKTKKLLKAKFGTIANMKQASLEELTAVVGEKIAEAIKKQL